MRTSCSASKQTTPTPLAELYDRYSSRAFGVASVICNSTERAEEAVQDAFLSVWRGRARYDEAHGGIRNLILALTRERSIDIYRRNRGNGRPSEPHLDRIAMFASGEDDTAQCDNGDRQLRAPQREVIALAYFGGLTHAEIAARLDVPLDTVMGRMRRGLEEARAEIVLQDDD